MKLASLIASARKTLLVFSLVPFFLLLALVNPAKADEYAISGRVTDSSSNAIEGATVEAVDTATHTVVASTDTNFSGDYSLTVSPGTYDIHVSPPSGGDFGTAVASGRTISANTIINFFLVPAGSAVLSGHIYDQLGNPIPYQNVRLFGGGGLSEVYTDTAGGYSFQLSVGEYEFSVSGSSNPLTVNAPQSYAITNGHITLTESRVLDITLPVKRVTVHVQDSLDNPVSGVRINVPYNTANSGSLSLGEGITARGENGYGSGPTTDSSGDATLWLLPNDQDYTYTFVATPPSGSIYGVFTLSNVAVTDDQTEIISLQFIHEPPVTTATLSPEPNAQGEYEDPTTVTLSAMAASGFSIANTYYTVDGGTQQTYSAPFDVSGGGEHTIEFWSVDNVGVFESPNELIFTISPATQLTALSPAEIWVGLKNSDDIGIRFDLLAEVYKNFDLIGSGELDSVAGGSSGFNNARLNSIPLTLNSAVAVSAGDQFSIKLYVRNACVGSGKNSGGARLWYNDSAANSHFDATVAGSTNNYYLWEDSALNTTVGDGPRLNVDVAAGAKCSPFKLFGTWNTSF
jgi:hypothetical protein